MRALKDFTTYCQTTYEPTAETAMMKIIPLLAITLEPNKPLVMLQVPNVITAVVDGEEVEVEPEDSAPPAATQEKRAHLALTPTGRTTREKINYGLASRFLPRYNAAGLSSRQHLFDRVMLLSPKFQTLKYIDTFAVSTAGKACAMASAGLVRARIHLEVVELITEAVVELRARAAKAGTGADAGAADQAAAKRVKTSHGSSAVAAKQTESDLQDLGLLEDIGDIEEDGQPGQEVAAQEEAKTILNGWLQTKVSRPRVGLVWYLRKLTRAAVDTLTAVGGLRKLLLGNKHTSISFVLSGVCKRVVVSTTTELFP